jgi:predicted HD superfamily hydrolase involved in NAD metabolism
MNYSIEEIKDIVRGLTCEKRFAHTLGVVREAEALGRLYLPKKVEKLKLTALLHDITKDFSKEKQIELCKEYKLELDYSSIVPKLLHSKTGCQYARNLFGSDTVDDEVYNGIFFHTTGRENMTLFESIIYLADYIEDTRTFEDCITLRKFFYESIEKADSYEQKIEALRKTMVLSFDFTIKNLIDEGKLIDFDTIKARNYFISAENVFND